MNTGIVVKDYTKTSMYKVHTWDTLMEGDSKYNYSELYPISSYLPL